MSYTYRPFGTFRLLLASLVMFQHFSADLAPAPFSNLFLPYEVGGVAVLVFFALSGFVICEAAEAVYGGKPAAFLGNRLLRILPHFILAVALSILLHWFFLASGGVRLWRSQPGFPAAIAFAPVNLLLNFIDVLPLSDRFISYQFLDIVWAVRVEMAFYLVIFGFLALGRWLPAARRLGRTAALGLPPLAAAFVVAAMGHGPAMLLFVPYFVFGGALFYATQRRRGAWAIMAISLPAMGWQYVHNAGAGPLHPAARPSLPAGLILLGILLAALAVLAFSRTARFRSVDRVLGNLTYPLYLYHEDVLVLLLTMTAGYSYGVFIAGMLASVLAAITACACVDPLVNRWRDRIRGGKIEAAAPAMPAAMTSALTALEAAVRPVAE